MPIEYPLMLDFCFFNLFILKILKVCLDFFSIFHAHTWPGVECCSLWCLNTSNNSFFNWPDSSQILNQKVRLYAEIIMSFIVSQYQCVVNPKILCLFLGGRYRQIEQSGFFMR